MTIYLVSEVGSVEKDAPDSKPSPPSSLPLGAAADMLSGDAISSPSKEKPNPEGTTSPGEVGSGGAASLESPSTDSMGEVPPGGILLEADSRGSDESRSTGEARTPDEAPPMARNNSRHEKFKNIPRMNQVKQKKFQIIPVYQQLFNWFSSGSTFRNIM